MRTIVAAVTTVALSSDLGAQGSPSNSGSTVTVGAAVAVSPRYPGSDDHRLRPYPMLEWALGTRRVTAGPRPGGDGGTVSALVTGTSGIGFAAELGFLDDRPESRADALAGMDDRGRVATIGGMLSYRAGPLQASAGATRGLNDGAGTLGMARLAVVLPFGRLILIPGVSATFADVKQMRRDFGVSEIEAVRRQHLIDGGDGRLKDDEGFAYRPDGGLRQVGGSLALMHVVSPRWAFVGFGGAERLSDEAAESPLVRERQQYSGGVGLRWRL